MALLRVGASPAPAAAALQPLQARGFLGVRERRAREALAAMREL